MLRMQVIGGVRVFKVRWLGYGAAHDTWEPADMVSGQCCAGMCVAVGEALKHFQKNIGNRKEMDGWHGACDGGGDGGHMCFK